MSADENTSETLALDAPVTALPGIGDKRAATLAALNIHTVADLARHLPREYRDRSHIQHIADAAPGAQITIEAEIVHARSLRLRGGKNMALFEVRDDTGTIKVSMFGRGFLAHTALKPGTRCVFTGKVSEYKGLTIQNPEYEPAAEDEDADQRLHTGCIVPLYKLTEGVSQRNLRRWMSIALNAIGELPETLPRLLREARQLPGLSYALRAVHFPESMADADAARRRFAYEELLTMQTGILLHRADMVDANPGIAHRAEGPLFERFQAQLPFQLTPGQARAVDDILMDMARPKPMFRLLQGDVGCGKTLVALHAVVRAADNHSQTAFMAPTEILAEQHFATLHAALEPLGIRCALLTGATPRAAQVRQALANGEIQVVVGTQALYQEQTSFQQLGLIIIDEQHRFGVRQREQLARKGPCPDILHATATPIPRTLAITLYGAMDISVIPDMPPGRRPVKTAFVPEEKRLDLYRYLREQAAQGRQSYIVCPLVEESEHFAGLTPLIDHYLALEKGPLAGLRMELLHGRLDSREKELIMGRFKAGEIDILFATTVIEVGVDTPTATTIVIEDAGRFGLTQLHQLRGRVGRGPLESHCFLLGAPTTPEGKERMEILRSCDNGFDIAEADLRLRGPGEYCGMRQSGITDFRAADLLRDIRLLDDARRDAATLLQSDPALCNPEHQALAHAAKKMADIFV